MTLDASLPRSAHRFPAIRHAPVEGFKPTHRAIGSSAQFELLSDEHGVLLYPTMTPAVLVRDETGRHLVILEERWDQRNKKGKRVNYEPIT
jgi:hypothetical protein